MTDGNKEWVTVKIEEPVRDKAKDDPRTYTQIMQAGLDNEPMAEVSPEVSLDVDTVANALKETLGDVDAELSDEIQQQLDRIEAAAQTAEDRTGSIQRTVEDMEGRMR
jgi:hypothetical protein